MGNLWARFRSLPTPAKAGLALGLLALYTLVLVLILRDGDDTAQPRQRNATEQRVATFFTAAGDPTLVAGDVAEFRKPRLRDIKCDGTASCEVVYAVGLPGAGRILEQQQQLVKRVLVEGGITSLTLTVVRGSKIETGVPAKAEEETPTEAVLIRTACDRRKVDDAALAKMDPVALQRDLCRLERFSPNGRGNTTTVPPP